MLAHSICITSVERTVSNESLAEIVGWQLFVRQSSNLFVLLCLLYFIAFIKSSRDRFAYSRADSRTYTSIIIVKTYLCREIRVNIFNIKVEKLKSAPP